MASYVISEEDWFEDFVPGTFVESLVESLRLRAAWGKSGKQPASFAALKLLGPRRVTFRAEDVAGLSLVGPGNPGLKPERGQEVELGFEMDLLDGRLGLDFTWFRQTTKDAIVGRPLAPSTGYSAPLFTNIGEMTNRGVELGLSAVVLNTRTLRWDWRLNASSVKGEITDLEDRITFGLSGDSQRHEEGYPYASYFNRTYSIDQSGNAVASDSAVFVGHPTPELEGSISTSLELFDWVTLSADLGFAAGHQQFNSTEQFRCGFLGGGTYGGVCTELFEVGAGRRTDQPDQDQGGGSRRPAIRALDRRRRFCTAPERVCTVRVAGGVGRAHGGEARELHHCRGEPGAIHKLHGARPRGEFRGRIPEPAGGILHLASGEARHGAALNLVLMVGCLTCI